MGALPGGGVSIWRLAALNMCALGFGLTDGIFFIFLMQTLRVAGLSRQLSFTGLAVGGAFSIIAAPIAAVASTSINRRMTITYSMLLFGAFCTAGLGLLFSKYATDLEIASKKQWRAYAAIVLAGLYRASVQSSPVVPCIMDGAATRGSQEFFPIRRDISLSFFYIEYRVGLFASSLAVALLPTNIVTNLFPIMMTASLISLFITAIAAISFPKEIPEPPMYVEDVELNTSSGDSIFSTKAVESAVKAQPIDPFWTRFKDHMTNSLFRADKRLLASYVETIYYGISFGALGGITACFFEDVVLGNAQNPGTASAFRLAAYVGLLGIGIGLMVDGSLPTLVFRDRAKKFTMTVAWANGLFLGSALFFAMIFVRGKWASLIIFSSLNIASSTHNLFSLLLAGLALGDVPGLHGVLLRRARRRVLRLH